MVVTNNQTTIIYVASKNKIGKISGCNGLNKDANKNCLSCSLNYYQDPLSINCLACPILTNCKSCANTTSCGLCNFGYLLQNDVCNKCSNILKNCNTCKS